MPGDERGNCLPAYTGSNIDRLVPQERWNVSRQRVSQSWFDRLSRPQMQDNTLEWGREMMGYVRSMLRDESQAMVVL